MPKPLLFSTPMVAVVLSLCCSETASAQSSGQFVSNPDTKTVVVSLQAAAVVDHPIATIASVATMQGGDPGLRQKIAGLDIAELTRVGRSVIVSRDQVVLRIQLAGIDSRAFRVDGPDHVMVRMNTFDLTAQEVVKAAQQNVLQRLKVEAKDVDFQVLDEVHLPAVNIAPDDQLQLVVDAQSPAIGQGRVRVEVSIFVNGQRRGMAAVVMGVTLYRQVAVATRRMETGELLQSEGVRPERRPVNERDQWLAYNDQLLGKRVLHTVPAGHTLTSGDLDIPPPEDQLLIRARDNVKLVAAVGNIRVSAAGEALQEGKLGQIIRVRNIDSGKTVVGRVVDRTTVEVEY